MNLLQMSRSGAVMILVIVVIRALAINKLPKKAFLVLWGVVTVRLLIPYSLPSSLSVYSLLEHFAPTSEVVTDMPATPFAPMSPTHNVMPVPGTSATNMAAASVDPWIIVWMVGALVCAVFFAVAYLKCRREFKASLPVDNEYVRHWLSEHRIHRTIEIRQSGRISAPLTYGVFRPVILMPKTADWDDSDTLKYVLAHEYVHIRRFDAVTKLVLTAALCVHWFNPAVWIMYVLANRDIELSCDEAVIRQFGERTKSAYAMTLIRMEETRSGLTPLCNNFSKNAIEERIIAVMKIKKTSLVAVLVAMALVVGVTTAFATSGQTAAASDIGKNDTANTVQTVTGDYTVTSYTNPADGKTYYSWDGGKTWTAMTEKEFNDTSAWNGVEWWTAEEYRAWLEQEKVDLQAIIGSQGWTPSTGWFTWTQEMVDETIARYEQTLKDIQAGQKISKPTADGDTMIQFGFDPDAQTSITDTQTAVGYAEKLESISDDDVAVGYKQQLTPELLAEYKTYGLIYDEAKDAFYFNGKLVRWFFDGYDMENGIATIYDYVNEDGVVDIRTVRQATQNADGSTNPGGKLAGIKEVSQEEFDSRFIMTPQTAQEAVTFGFVGGTGGTTFEDRFAKYKAFGIEYVEAEGASGAGNVYYNGQLVSRFADLTPDGGAFTFTSAEQGGINVKTVYDNSGRLTGVETVAA